MDKENNNGNPAMELSKPNQKKELIIASTIIALAILIYGFLNYDYKLRTLEFEKEKEAGRIKLEEQKKAEIEQNKLDLEAEKADNQKKYLLCLSAVSKGKTEWWNKECKARGLNDDCQLPLDNVDRINNQTKIDKDNCYKLFMTD